MKKLAWLLCPVIVVVMSAIVSATPPSIPSKNMDMRIDINGTPALGAEVEVVFTFTLRDSITHHGNAMDTAWIDYPAGATLLQGQTSWVGRLVADEEHTITARFRLDSNMVFCASGIVKSEGMDLFAAPPDIVSRYETRPFRYENSVSSERFVIGEVPDVSNTVPWSVFFGDSDSSWTGRIPLDSVPGRLVLTPQGERVVLDNEGNRMQVNDTLFVRITSEEISKSLFDEAPILRNIGGPKPLIKIKLPRDFKIDEFSVTASSRKIPSVQELIPENSLLIKRESIEIRDTINIDLNGVKLRLIASKLDGYYISGYFTYLDNWGDEQPVRMCTVQLYILEEGIYYLDWTTQSGDNGYFQVWCDHPDYKIVVLSSNDRATTIYSEDHSPSLGDYFYTYGWGVSGYNHYQDHEIPSQYTTITDIAGRGSWNICNIGMFGADFVIDAENTEVEAFYCWDQQDSQTTTSYLSGALAIGDTRLIFIDAYTGGGVTDDRDEWDSIVVLHEYSHLLMDKLASMSGPNYSPHYFDFPDLAQTSQVLKTGAYKEGWATFLASAMIYSESHQFPRFFARNKDNAFTHRYWFEFPDPDVPYMVYPQGGATSSSPLFEGANVEGAVMIALRDLFDALNDGDYYLGGQFWGHNNDYNSADYWQGIDYIWDVFWDYDPRPADPDINYCRTIYDFIEGWRVKGYPILGHFKDIMNAHNVAVFLPGDANNSGGVTISDAVKIVNYVFGGGAAPVPVLASGDANGDCMISISDAQYVLSYAFSGGPAPVAGCS